MLQTLKSTLIHKPSQFSELFWDTDNNLINYLYNYLYNVYLSLQSKCRDAKGLNHPVYFCIPVPKDVVDI